MAHKMAHKMPSLPSSPSFILHLPPLNLLLLLLLLLLHLNFSAPLSLQKYTVTPPHLHSPLSIRSCLKSADYNLESIKSEIPNLQNFSIPQFKRPKRLGDVVIDGEDMSEVRETFKNARRPRNFILVVLLLLKDSTIRFLNVRFCEDGSGLILCYVVCGVCVCVCVCFFYFVRKPPRRTSPPRSANDRRCHSKPNSIIKNKTLVYLTSFYKIAVLVFFSLSLTS